MPEYASLACVQVPLRRRVIIVSDLFLGAKRTEASAAASSALAKALDLRGRPWSTRHRRQHLDLLVPPGGDPPRPSGPTRSCARHLPAISLLPATAGRSCSRAAATGRSCTTRRPTTPSSPPASKWRSKPSLPSRLQAATGTCGCEPGWRFDDRNALVDPANHHETPAWPTCRCRDPAGTRRAWARPGSTASTV